MGWNIDTTKKFVNPYNFVPLDEHPDRRNVDDFRGSNVGRITCELKIMSPLAYPDHRVRAGKRLSEQMDDVHYSYPFLRVNGSPTIMGSELRGMIRSVFEAATNSCLSVLENKTLTGRSRLIKKDAGLLYYTVDKKGEKEWKLQPAVSYALNTFRPGLDDYHEIRTEKGRRFIRIGNKEYESGTTVSFTAKSQNKGPKRVSRLGRGDKRGILLIGELGMNANNRRSSHVFVKKDGILLSVTKETVESLEQVLRDYRDDTINLCAEEQHSGYVGYSLPTDESQFLPVFYDTADGYDYMSPAMISRESYRNSLSVLAGEYRSCDGKYGFVCPACSVFGMIGNGHSYGSVIRVSDAKMTDAPQPDDLQFITLKELSGPKVTSYEFYTWYTDPEAKIWTPDYASDGRQKHAIEDGELQLRGRKFYLNHDPYRESNAVTDEKTKRNCTVEVLRKGSFTFDVYFDGISDRMLEALKWCLQPSNGAGRRLWYKLGHGKPLGLGSVELSIRGIEQRSFSPEKGYRVVRKEKTECGFKAPEALCRMLDPQLVPRNIPVCYPIGDKGGSDANSKGPHQWFAGNRELKGTGVNPGLAYILPPVDSADLCLPAIKASFESAANVGNRQLQGTDHGYHPQQKQFYDLNAVIIEMIDAKKAKVLVEDTDTVTITINDGRAHSVGETLRVHCAWEANRSDYRYTLLK